MPLIPSDALAPLAVLADDALYLGNLVRLPDGEGECYVGKPFSGKVFDVSVCKDRLLCAKQALTSLQENLRKVFSAPPFESGPITGEDFAPGEFGLKRVREPSTLLGPPAYEISTYTFQTWSADADNPFGSLYGRQDFYGVQDKRDAMLPIAYLFLKVTHVLTTSIHRNGVYSEPEPNQVSKAEKLVSAAVQDSIAKTCANIGGKMLQSVCVVP